MSKSLFLALTLSIIAIVGKAQYLRYEPNPIIKVDPVDIQPMLIQPMQLMPSPRYLTPSKVDAAPTISIRTKFLIQSAIVDGHNFSQHYKNASAGIAIYNVSGEASPFMAIVMPADNSNSNGKMLAVTQKEVPQTNTEAGKTIMTFAWEYTNSYDGKTGSATVTLTKEYRQEGTYVNCHMITGGVVSDFTGMIPNN